MVETLEIEKEKEEKEPSTLAEVITSQQLSSRSQVVQQPQQGRGKCIHLQIGFYCSNIAKFKLLMVYYCSICVCFKRGNNKATFSIMTPLRSRVVYMCCSIFRTN